MRRQIMMLDNRVSTDRLVMRSCSTEALELDLSTAGWFSRMAYLFLRWAGARFYVAEEKHTIYTVPIPDEIELSEAIGLQQREIQMIWDRSCVAVICGAKQMEKIWGQRPIPPGIAPVKMRVTVGYSIRVIGLPVCFCPWIDGAVLVTRQMAESIAASIQD